MRYGFLILYMKKCANISPYMRRPLVIYDFATAPLWISLYMRKIWFFLSVYSVSSLYIYYSMEKAFTVTSEEKEERTMDRSGSVTENASHPTKSSRGRNKKQKRDRSRGRKDTRTSHSVSAEQLFCCNCPIFPCDITGRGSSPPFLYV